MMSYSEQTDSDSASINVSKIFIFIILNYYIKYNNYIFYDSYFTEMLNYIP